MTDKTTRPQLTVIPGGSIGEIASDPSPQESLDLIRTFTRITSGADRRKVIALATRLAGA